ncbi:hypothetical protein GGR50DRAFT_441206 [Xylaria sp. CBS 124048]|nr:hypothetical protein GGR50DRAFT_441206 [Xylaria sp. CBS 124048]
MSRPSQDRWGGDAQRWLMSCEIQFLVTSTVEITPLRESRQSDPYIHGVISKERRSNEYSCPCQLFSTMSVGFRHTTYREGGWFGIFAILRSIYAELYFVFHPNLPTKTSPGREAPMTSKKLDTFYFFFIYRFETKRKRPSICNLVSCNNFKARDRSYAGLGLSQATPVPIHAYIHFLFPSPSLPFHAHACVYPSVCFPFIVTFSY